VATDDQDKIDTALANLSDYGQTFSSFLDTATEGRLPQADIEASLQMHVTTLTAAIDAVVAGDTTAFTKLREAGQHMPGTAAVLAAAFDDQFDLDGDAGSPASELRAGLTSLLQEHVYLAGIAVNVAVDAGGDTDDPAFVAAADALDENTVALADAIGSLYGDEARGDFLDMWRAHIGFFVEYTLGVATDDQGRIDAALDDLEDYGQTFSSFLDTATDGRLPQADVEASLQMHVTTLTAAIDAVVAGETTAYGDLQVAAEHMMGTATVLSVAFDDQFEL
jgi:hypothetical protein